MQRPGGISRSKWCKELRKNSGVQGVLGGWRVALWSLAHVAVFIPLPRHSRHFFFLLYALCLALSTIIIFPFYWLTLPLTLSRNTEPVGFSLRWASLVSEWVSIFVHNEFIFHFSFLKLVTLVMVLSNAFLGAFIKRIVLVLWNTLTLLSLHKLIFWSEFIRCAIIAAWNLSLSHLRHLSGFSWYESWYCIAGSILDILNLKLLLFGRLPIDGFHSALKRFSFLITALFVM